jgi:hypothetical protein
MTGAYLKKLRALKTKTGLPQTLPKLSKHSPVVEAAVEATADVGFVSFGSTPTIGFPNFRSPPARAEFTTGGGRPGSLGRVLSALKARCPDGVPTDRWKRAVRDGQHFLSRWGEQAEALGWTAKDLFGLLPIPDRAAPWFDRLSRYDETGLVWLLRGRPVAALTEATAAIENPKTGNITVYRRFNKPGLGPLGDSLDDLS